MRKNHFDSLLKILKSGCDQKVGPVPQAEKIKLPEVNPDRITKTPSRIPQAQKKMKDANESDIAKRKKLPKVIFKIFIFNSHAVGMACEAIRRVRTGLGQKLKNWPISLKLSGIG